MKNYFIFNQEKEPWQIAAARCCVENSELGFTKDGLIRHIESSYKVNNRHIEQFWDEEIYKPSGREHTRPWLSGSSGSLWIPPLDLVSKITDYDELQEARRSSRQAMLIATGSLVIAIIVGIIQICIEIYK